MKQNTMNPTTNKVTTDRIDPEQGRLEFEDQLTDDQRHIDRLRRHGAKVILDGIPTEINSYFYDRAVSECWLKDYLGIMFKMTIPETDEILALAIYADGHVDSGSADLVMRCVQSHRV